MQWQPDRHSALNRLEAFIPQAGQQYSRNRNADLGRIEDNNVSGLSPWLRCGVISELEVLEATLRQHSVSAAEKFIMEVFWRAYFKGWLQHRPQVWVDYQFQLTGLLVEFQNNEDYLRAIGGQTGINCFDAWVAELTETGYLHNHSRMWFASIWIFTLKLPWQLGANFFMQHLLDGDPAANTLSWRWVAGLHTKGKTYLARADNISRYTGGRFDPVSGLASQAEAIVEAQDYPRKNLSFNTASASSNNLLLVTDECCHAETILSLDGTQAVFGLTGTAGNVSEQVQRFRNQAVTESCEKIASRHAIPCSTGSYTELQNWLADNNISEIITVQPSIGPTQEMLQLLESRLKNLGITLRQQTRAYDQHCWPYATAGFFKLKTKIPAILKKLDLSEGGQQSLAL